MLLKNQTSLLNLGEFSNSPPPSPRVYSNLTAIYVLGIFPGPRLFQPILLLGTKEKQDHRVEHQIHYATLEEVSKKISMTNNLQQKLQKKKFKTITVKNVHIILILILH